MTEWYNSQRKAKDDVRKLLHKRINDNRIKREILTYEEQQSS